MSVWWEGEQFIFLHLKTKATAFFVLEFSSTLQTPGSLVFPLKKLAMVALPVSVHLATHLATGVATHVARCMATRLAACGNFMLTVADLLL